MTPSYENNGVEADEQWSKTLQFVEIKKQPRQKRAVNGAHEVWRKSNDGRDPKPVSLYLSLHATAKKRWTVDFLTNFHVNVWHLTNPRHPLKKKKHTTWSFRRPSNAQSIPNVFQTGTAENSPRLWKVPIGCWAVGVVLETTADGSEFRLTTVWMYKAL